MGDLRVGVVNHDALNYKVDVLALKYAQDFYGVDLAIRDRLLEYDLNLLNNMPDPGDFRLLNGGNLVAADWLLFVGVEPLNQFTYEDIHDWAGITLLTLMSTMPDTKHLGLTVHGVNNGLDAQEAVVAEITGLLDAIQAGDFPPSLQRLTIIEREPYRVKLIDNAIADIVRQGIFFLREDGGFIRFSYDYPS